MRIMVDGVLVEISPEEEHVILPNLAQTPDAPRRVASVLPVAFRWAARATPMPGGAGTVMDALLAGVRGDPDKADALEYAVRYEREDLIEAGMPEALADHVLALAATRPGSGATYEPIPAAPPDEPPADEA